MTVVQRKKTVAVHLKIVQLPPFSFLRQYTAMFTISQ